MKSDLRGILISVSGKRVLFLLYTILYPFLVSIFYKVKSVYFFIFMFARCVIIIGRFIGTGGLVCGVGGVGGVGCTCGIPIKIRKYLR